MRHGGVSILLAAALTSACAPAPPPPAPEASPVVLTATPALAALDPPPPGPPTLADRIRQEGWLVRFWEQLTPAQRRRITTRLRQHSPPLARDETEAAPVWDGLGLPERDALVFVGRLPKP